MKTPKQKAYNIPRWIWWKYYFDKGRGIVSYIDEALAGVLFLGGFYSIQEAIPIKILSMLMVLLAVVAVIGCFIVGWLWVKFDLSDYENEITNQLDPLAKQLRVNLNIEDKLIKRDLKRK